MRMAWRQSQLGCDSLSLRVPGKNCYVTGTVRNAANNRKLAEKKLKHHENR